MVFWVLFRRCEHRLLCFTWINIKRGIGVKQECRRVEMKSSPYRMYDDGCMVDGDDVISTLIHLFISCLLNDLLRLLMTSQMNISSCLLSDDKPPTFLLLNRVPLCPQGTGRSARGGERRPREGHPGCRLPAAAADRPGLGLPFLHGRHPAPRAGPRQRRGEGTARTRRAR